MSLIYYTPQTDGTTAFGAIIQKSYDYIMSDVYILGGVILVAILLYVYVRYWYW